MTGSVGIQEAAALAACSCLENKQGLETLRTLVTNIVKHPQEEKFRSVSDVALEKRGLTSECREFLCSVGFIEERGCLCLHGAVCPEIFEGLAAIEDILQQGSTAVSSGCATSPEGAVVADLAQAVRPPQQESTPPVVAEPVETEPQSARMPDIEGMLVDMGFPVAKVKEVLSRLGNVNDVDAVLPELLALVESPAVSRSLADAAQAIRVESQQSEENQELDMPTLERWHMSGNSRQVLQSVFSAQGIGSVKEAARLLLSLSAALNQGLLTEKQRRDLHEHILAGRADEVRGIVDAIGVEVTPDMLLPRGEPTWQCLVCFDQQEACGWQCPSGHRFCGTCMQHHIEAVSFPKCPMCDYALGESDFTRLKVPMERIEAYHEARLHIAVDTLAQGEETLVRCSRPECANAVLMSTHGRQLFACGVCGAAAFCTMCRQSPYHYHVGCSRVQPLREKWLAWISGGRDDYHGRARTAVEADRRNVVLYEGIERHNELEADERWKAENCKLCPSCSRPISKVEGCDDMVCGRSWHGGDQQPGCGKKFNWAAAPSYVAHIKRQKVPTGIADSRLRGRDVFHPFIDCSLCGAHGIAGLRFRCIHCHCFDVCSSCEPRLGDLHEVDHVFEILFESDFRIPWLPRDTRVRIVRSGDKAPKSLTRCSITDLEGLCGNVVGRRRLPVEAYRVELDHGQGVVEFDPEFLDLVITSREAAEQLWVRTLDQEGDDGAGTHTPGAGEALECSTAGCRRRPWNRQPGQPCCRTCTQGGSTHGPTCEQTWLTEVPARPLPMRPPVVEDNFADDSPLSSEGDEAPRRPGLPPGRRPLPPPGRRRGRLGGKGKGKGSESFAYGKGKKRGAGD